MSGMLRADLVAWIHLVATLYMTGLIWFVQVVHYPLFDRVPESGFGRYQAGHLERTSPVVLPPMLLELACAVLLVAYPASTAARSSAWFGIVALAVIWISTFTLQVPCHSILKRGFDRRAHRRLVATNWIRTGLWTLRAALAIRILHLT